MAWLWIISVGVTDVQFPVWSKDPYGQWIGPRRFETGRAGIRAVHEGLLALLQHGQICFESGVPKPLDRGVARDLRLEFLQDGTEFVMTIRHTEYRISGKADTIPNPHETQLPLYCPKVEALLPLARETFAGGQVTVLVLNTRRADGFSEAASEPVAAGPLVAHCLAERLGLAWIDEQGQVPKALAPNTATWVDILTGNEPMEDFGAQRNVVARLGAAIRAWDPGGAGGACVAVTTSGGMPPLKPLIERVPAICLGQDRVILLDQPERGPAKSEQLKYDARVAEREVLRFYCAEALRVGDYTGAYGLASRAAGQPWGQAVQDGLGALLELPGSPLRLGDWNLPMSALTACRIEIRLCCGDSIGALMRLGTFIESWIWELIPRDDRIQRMGLQIDRDAGYLEGPLRLGHPLVRLGMLARDSEGMDRHRVLDLSWRWPDWLTHEDSGQLDLAESLANFNGRYAKKSRELRNRQIHGTSAPIAPQDIESALMKGQLIAGMGRPFGENFLCVPDVRLLLRHTVSANLAVTVAEHLKTILNSVIEG
jgi:hypothetical protein